MKHLFLMITFLFAVATSFAQQPDTAFFAKETNFFAKGNAKNEIGIDATWFVKNILNFGGTSGYSNNYLIQYKRFLKKNQAIRFGVGGRILKRDETMDQTAMQDQIKYNNYYFNARLGFEFRNTFGKRWLFYYGADLLAWYRYSSQKAIHTATSVYETENISKSVSWGLGPVIGFEFALNSRLSLSTEGSLYFMHTHQNEKYLNKNTPQSNLENTSKNSYMSIQVPLSLYINYRF